MALTHRSKRATGRPRASNQGGFAMVAVMVVGMIVVSLSVVAVQLSLHSLNTTSADRSRTVSVETAEGGLQAMFEQIGAATTAVALPCGTQPAVPLPSAPTVSSYTVTVTYYGTYPVSSPALTCAQVNSGTTVAAADIVSVGSTAVYGTRKMESLVHLTTSNSAGSPFDMALFSSQALTGKNNPVIYPYGNNDANVYSNQSLTCGNNMVIHGNVYVQGTFTGTSNCIIYGDVYTTAGITLSKNAVVQGNAKVSAGTISMSGNSVVQQAAYASSTITLSGQAAVLHGTYPNSNLTSPPSETMPTLNWSQSAWSTAGYTTTTDNTCTSVATDISTAIAGASTPQAFTTSCAVSYSGNTTISVKQSLAIFSSGGFSMSNNTYWQSADGQPHTLYFVVPSSAGTTPCSSPGISLSNNVSFDPLLTLLWYTPCTMTISNNSAGYGQVYAGQLSVQNNFTQHFKPVGVVPGAATATSSQYTVNISYEREIS